MNLITSSSSSASSSASSTASSTSSESKLDRQQEKAIFELTLKKLRSKKSTVSEKQAAALQQLAIELVGCKVLDVELRLEQLQNELERRLHQYEYLVAQEKAILGAYKINLFTSEGVNNLHLFSLDQKSQYYK